MKSYARLPLCAGVAVVLIATCVFFLTKLGGQQAADSLDLLKWTGKFGDALRQQTALEARAAPVFRRTIEKRRIAHELIAHHLTAREAVDQFRELDVEVAETEPDPQLRPSLDEGEARHSVLLWVQAELAQHPGVGEDVVDEIERDINAHAAAGG
jgi:hypothetical protein